MGMAAMEVMAAVRSGNGPARRTGASHSGPPAINTDRGGVMLNMKVVSWALKSCGAITFIVCVLYWLIVPESLHMKSILEQMLPAFQ
jgi:hypothetical protein